MARESANDPLPSVLFDFAQLTQLFRQLISNAIIFRGSEPPKIHVSAIDMDNEIQFSIRDNGIGIDPRYHEQIFGVFKRLHGREFPARESVWRSRNELSSSAAEDLG